MIKKLIFTVLALCVIFSVALKLVVHYGFQDSITKNVVYPSSKYSSPTFVFSGVEMNLPWSNINGVFADRNIIVFATDGQRKVSIYLLPTPTETAAFTAKMHVAQLQMSAYQKMRNRIQKFFVGDLEQLSNHPEQVNRIRLPWLSGITWRSNPLSDARIAVGLISMRTVGAVDQIYPVETPYMQGYHERFHVNNSTQIVHVYTLGMKDGTRNMHIMMHEGTEDFTAPLLSSIRIIQISKDFSQVAFNKSKHLVETSHGNAATQKLALLAAIEAASNTSPKLTYFIHVLDICREFHFPILMKAWTNSTLHYFPASKSELAKRFH
jgi:hypothetical protein